MNILFPVLTVRKKIIFILGSSILVAIIGYIDFLTGDEISINVFYIIPIIIISWYLNLKTGLIFVFICRMVAIAILVSFQNVLTEKKIALITFAWNEIATFIIYSAFAGLVHLLRKQYEKERELSRLDPLTGIGNFRSYYELTERELERSLRYGHSFGIFYIDCDNFKDINDTYGHPKGDELLKTVAIILKKNIRKTDFSFRLGGDEFCVLLPEAGSVETEMVLKKIKNILSSRVDRENWPVTFSIGAAVWYKPPGRVEDILDMADKLMYQSKKGGKNRITFEIIE